MNVYIYGCGKLGKSVLMPLKNRFAYNVEGYIDKSGDLPGDYMGVPVFKTEKFDYCNVENNLILVAIGDYVEAVNVKRFLESKGCSGDNIKLLYFDADYIELFSDERTSFIKDFALWCEKSNINGNVAECGVFRGDSAKFINSYFDERKLYLFDTFEGFDESDLEHEINAIGEGFAKEYFTKERFFDVITDEIMLKMTSPENIIIKKGYFPMSAEGIEDRFCFVNLDMDLFQPMLAGLRFFWERMEKGGVILLHDYFHTGLKGVEKAVESFEKEIGTTLPKIPIGDHFSLAIIK